MSDFHFLSIDQEDTNLKPSFIEKSICFLGTIARQKSLENNAMLIIKFFFFFWNSACGTATFASVCLYTNYMLEHKKGYRKYLSHKTVGILISVSVGAM